MNICILTDNSWDNVPILIRRLKKLSPDCKIHTIYSPKLKNINRASKDCCVQLLRHSAKTISEALCNILSFCDICFLFHNFIEYNTPTSIASELCKEYSIPCLLFTEYTKDYYFNDSVCSISLSKTLKTLDKRETKAVIFNDELLNDTTKIRVLPSMEESKEILRVSYEKNKKTREITTLYDKDVHRKEKLSNKMEKAAKHLEYTTNRANFYKQKPH